MPETEPPRRNFPLLLAQGSAYSLAGQLASTSIVLPFLCAALGGSLLVAGLLVPLNTLGTLVGYTLGPALLASRLPSRVVVGLTAMTTAVLLLVLAGVSTLLPGRGAAVSLTFVAVAIGAGLASGAGTIAWTDVLARGIARPRHSTLILSQAAIGGALASAVAVVSAWVFSSRTPIVGHIALEWFAVGFLVLSGACAMLVALDRGVSTAGHPSLAATVRAGVAATRRYPWLRGYLVHQVMFLSVSLATTFYSIRVAALHGSVPGSLAVIIAVTSTALVAGALLWKGVLTRRGYRGMLVGGTLCGAAAAGGAVLVEGLSLVGSPVVHAVLMLLATLAADAVSVSKSAYLVAHAPPDELPQLSAFSQLTIGLSSAVLAAALATVAQLHGTVWPVGILLVLNIVAVVGATRVPRPTGPVTARP
jgi:hypothetical protein